MSYSNWLYPNVYIVLYCHPCNLDLVLKLLDRKPKSFKANAYKSIVFLHNSQELIG